MRNDINKISLSQRMAQADAIASKGYTDDDDVKRVIKDFIDDDGLSEWMKNTYKNLSDISKDKSRLAGISYVLEGCIKYITDVMRYMDKGITPMGINIREPIVEFLKLNYEKYCTYMSPYRTDIDVSYGEEDDKRIKDMLSDASMYGIVEYELCSIAGTIERQPYYTVKDVAKLLVEKIGKSWQLTVTDRKVYFGRIEAAWIMFYYYFYDVILNYMGIA